MCGKLITASGTHMLAGHCSAAGEACRGYHQEHEGTSKRLLRLSVSRALPTSKAGG